MKVRSIFIQNYGSYYGQHEFRLSDRGLTLVMGDNLDETKMDSNGSGKSTVFEALDWCWFGKPPKGGLAESVINEEAFLERGAECLVRTQLYTDTMEEMVIERGKTKSKNTLVLKVGSQDLTTLDTNETQQLIERYLGMDRAVFHSAVFFAQTDMVRYADSTDAERMDVLTKLLQLGDIDEYLEKAKEKLKVKKLELTTIEKDKIATEGRISGMQNVDFRAAIKQWEAERKQNIQNLEQHIQSVQQSGAELQAELANLEKLNQQKERLNRELTLMQPPQPPPEAVEARSTVSKLTTDVGVAHHEIKTVEQRLMKMQTMQEGVCSECGQPVTAGHLGNEVRKLQAAMQAALDKASSVKMAQAQWQTHLASLEAESAARNQAYQQLREKSIQEITVVDQQIRTLSGKQSTLGTLQYQIESLEKQIVNAQAAVNPYLEQQKEHQRNWDMLHHRLADIEQAQHYTAEEVDYLEFWVKALGPQGLKSYILDSQLQVLTDAANQWVRLLTGGTIWVRFESQKQTQKKSLVNAPDIRIFRWNPDNTITERMYRNWSGGEKKRISFAVDFGLSRLIATRARKSYDILILDEVFKHLDRAGREAIMEMLQILSREKSSVFVVEHDAEFQGMFENIVRTVKASRRSTIQEMTNVQSTQGAAGAVQAQHLRSGTANQPIGSDTPIRRPIA